MSKPPERFHICGHEVKCPHCGNNTFYTRDSLLNTAGMTFLKLDWMNQTAENYICSQCGRIEWFLPHGDTGGYSLAETTECLTCNAEIPAGQNACPECGWTYEKPE